MVKVGPLQATNFIAFSLLPQLIQHKKRERMNLRPGEEGGYIDNVISGLSLSADEQSVTFS